MGLAFYDYYVTKGSAKSDTNGGTMFTGNSQVYTNDGPCVEKANCSSDAVLGTIITNDDEDGWGTAASGDMLCFDTATLKEFAMISAVDGNTITVDGNWAVTPSQSGVNVKVGGAWEHIQGGVDRITTVWAGTSDGVRLNVHYAGGVAYDEQVDVDTNSGTVTKPIVIEGYETTAGDGCPNGNKPLIESSTSGNTYELGTVNYTVHINLKVKNSADNGNAIDGNNRSRSMWLFCDGELAGSGTGAALYALTDSVFGCHAKVSSSGAATVALINGATWDKCTFEGGKGAVYNVDMADWSHLRNCIFTGTVDGDCIRMMSNCSVAGCTIHAADDCNIYGRSGYGLNLLANNIVTKANKEWGLNAAGGAIWGVGNCWGADGQANNSGATTGLYHALRDDQTADPKYTNEGGGDLTLASDSPCKAAAQPDTLPGTTLVTYQDTGALQREEPGGGGGGLLQGNKRANMQ